MRSFEEYATKEENSNPWNNDLKKTLEHMWLYLYEGYQNRFKDYTAHYLEKLTRNISRGSVM